MRITNYLFYITLSILIISCSKSDDQKYAHLRKKVLEHYQTDSNPLKIKAARFLLDNLKDRYAVDGQRNKVYVDIIQKYYQNADTLHKKLNAIKDFPLPSFRINDISSISPDYLIDNIDLAFATWEGTRWKNEISFADFCQYMLPYRLGNEPLESWRKEILQDSIFKVVGDSLRTFSDAKTAVTWFALKCGKRTKNFKINWGSNGDNIPDLPYSSLKLLSTGTCANLNQIGLFMLRAAGFAIANDFTPNWANNKAGHDWSVIITKTGNIPFSLNSTDSLGKYKESYLVPAKVYRRTFSKNPQSHALQRGNCKFLPLIFNDANIVDVTDAYMPTHTISMPILTNPHHQKFAYMAVFSEVKGWIPTAWGMMINGAAHFSKAVGGAVYLPMLVYKSGEELGDYPFILSDKGVIHSLAPDFKHVQTIKLTRKFPLHPLNTTIMKSMLQARFEASNHMDFRDSVILFTIYKNPGFSPNEKLLKSAAKYRYVRYISADKCRCNIAELEFYNKVTDAKPLKGNPIGSKGHIKPLVNAFDGDALTYVSTDASSELRWVGLDLGKPTEISKIGYLSRSDRNHIVVGNKYELLYWNKEWKTLGLQTAKDTALVYNKIPTNSLFLLKNNTEGKEVRIFTYENGKQVWW